MADVILCKIAVEIAQGEEDHENVESDVRNFRYNNKYWNFLDWMNSAEMEIVQRILLRATYTVGPSLKFTEVLGKQNQMEEERLPNYLAVAYCPFEYIRQSDSYKNSLLRRQLFPIIYKDYAAQFDRFCVKDLRAADNSQSQNYITTKLYSLLYNKHSETATPTAPPLSLPASFHPTLRRYQERTVSWLLEREKNADMQPAFYMTLEPKKDREHCCSGPIYMHKFIMHLQLEPPNPLSLPSGGILADEMGLGKTVEILALLLLHPRKNFVISTPVFEYEDPVSPSLAKRPRLDQDIFCICVSKCDQNLIQCTKCGRWQHKHCVRESAKESPEYMCPSCWHESTSGAAEVTLVTSGATFIVTPAAIKLQWLSEIRRHTSELRVLIYDGVNAKHDRWISPRRLADGYDVVITDYSVLKKEFFHTAANRTERVTRNKPRFMRVHSPLLMLNWWRVCLDEAQMVESNTSNVAELVRMLPAVNRWAVTGTPIQRSLNDLHPLLRFIGFEEASKLSIWNNLVHDFVRHHNNDYDHHDEQQQQSPQLHLIDVLRMCMWRTCKSTVADELMIPPQSEKVHHIRLSNLEKLFYMEQHADCATKFNETLNKNIQRGYTISPQIMAQILQPLLKIRQCCNIPVINDTRQYRVGLTAGAQKQQFMQPKELHTYLKSANLMDCKNELRTMASSYNGMAGIFFLNKNYAEALKYYQLVLKLARDYTDINITVDSLLQIHALHNMLQSYYISEDNSLPASTLENYEQQLDQLEWRYLQPYAERLASAKSASLLAEQSMLKCFEIETTKPADKAAEEEDQTKTSDKVEDKEETHSSSLLELLAEILQALDREQEAQLINRLYDEGREKFSDNVRFEQIRSGRGALLTLTVWWDKVTSIQQSLNAKFEDLRFFTDNIHARNQVNPETWREMMEFIRSVYDCHLSDIREKKPKNAEGKVAKKAKRKLCNLCTIDKLLNNFVCLLWNKVIDEKTNLSEGLEVPSMEINLIKIIFNFNKFKQRNFNTKRIAKYAEALECMQNWYKKLLKFWIEIEYTVKAYDELDMCKMRISLTNDDDEKSIHRISAYTMDATFRDNQTNFYDAQQKFSVKLARLKYLTHLEGGADTSPCPICCSENETYAVLECGHHICYACLKQIRHYNRLVQAFNCPICRNKQNSCKIYYVLRDSAESLADTQPLVGYYSSKIAYIVRLVLRLQAEHSKEEKEPPKILIFSQWEPLLNAIAIALFENKIQHRLKWSPEAIEQFKSPNLGVTCLLMLLSRGSKGLNLIEATHVFLVEPILNPGEELQAIGRVHRFGQTKPTTVHRFIVLNTIEENVYDVVTRGKESEPNWEFNKIPLESLRDLFKLENDVVEDF